MAELRAYTARLRVEFGVAELEPAVHAQVINVMLSSKTGSIIVAHMNKPDSGTAEGIEANLPKLKSRLSVRALVGVSS
jgi:hypothetical protein